MSVETTVADIDNSNYMSRKLLIDLGFDLTKVDGNDEYYELRL